MNALEVVERMRQVSRPGFLAAFLFFLVREELGRVRMGKVIVGRLAALADNFTTYGHINVAYSDLMSTSQIKNEMRAIERLDDWDPSTETRFQIMEDILAVKAAIEKLDPGQLDRQERLTIRSLWQVIHPLWRAVETPQEPKTRQ